MPRFSDTRIHIAQLEQSTEDRPDILADHHFERCTIIGPAVLAPINTVSFTECTFGGHPDALLWEIVPGRQQVIGVIGLVNCSFVQCRLMKIGIAGPPEFVRRMRDELLRGSSAIASNVSTAPVGTA